MGPVLASGYQFPFPRSRSSREPVESVSNLQDPFPCAGIGQLPSRLPRLLRIRGLSAPHVAPNSSGHWFAADSPVEESGFELLVPP
jgi:hypothetical protein